MTVAKLESWLKLLPVADRDSPIIEVDGRYLTPREMLSEARAGTSIGLLAQRIWEGRVVTTDEALAVARIKKWLERYPPREPVVYILGGKGFLTREDIWEAVRARTPEGMKYIETELKYIEYLDKLKERV